MNEPQGWTVETLRQYVVEILRVTEDRNEQRFQDARDALRAALEAQKELVSAALYAADKAVLKAETAAEKRFDSVNEFRGLVADQQRTLMPRSEAEILNKSLDSKVEVLQSQVDKITGRRQGTGAGYSFVISIVSVVISLVMAIAVFMGTK